MIAGEADIRPMTAAVFIRKAALDLPSPPEAVASQFNLTPAGLRVLFAVIEIGGVPGVAPLLGISEQTAKTHLHRIYGKTGTKLPLGSIGIQRRFLAIPGILQTNLSMR